MRSPQGISAVRVKAFNPENVANIFSILEPEMVKFNHSPWKLYNVDETGITIVQGKYQKVVNYKGKKTNSYSNICRKWKLMHCDNMPQEHLFHRC